MCKHRGDVAAPVPSYSPTQPKNLGGQRRRRLLAVPVLAAPRSPWIAWLSSWRISCCTAALGPRTARSPGGSSIGRLGSAVEGREDNSAAIGRLAASSSSPRSGW